MADRKQVNEADLDWLAERDQPLTDAIRDAENNREHDAKCMCMYCRTFEVTDDH